MITEQTAQQLAEICPFSAIEYEHDTLEINAGCKMCGLCVKKGPPGAITLEQDIPKTTIDKNAWRGIAVFVEHQKGKIHNVTLELIGQAQKLARVIDHPVYAVMMGDDIATAAQTLLAYGVNTVYVYDDPALKHFMIEPYANAFADFIEKIKPSSILVGATNIGRSLAPRVAARFRTGLTADCTVLQMKQTTDLVQIRPAFGGNIMAQIVTPNCRPQFCTVRYKVFSVPAAAKNPSGHVKRLSLSQEKKQSLVQLLEQRPKPQVQDISEAQIIVAVGRGIKKQADLALAHQLAEALGGQLACTRPLVEAGFMDGKRQIGLSGRTVNAKLIITLGISGAVQFAAGMRGSGCIVAINSDPLAPIFDIAHYGLAGDLYEILPTLIAQCRKGERI